MRDLRIPVVLIGALLIFSGCGSNNSESEDTGVVENDVVTGDVSADIQVHDEGVADDRPDQDIEIVDQDVQGQDADVVGTDAENPDATDDAVETDQGVNIPDYPKVTGFEPPPAPSDSLGFEPPERPADGEPPTQAEITAFTKKLMKFFADSDYFNWVYRWSHGLDHSYDENMMGYRLWWQDCTYRRDGDTISFIHRRYAENIVKRTIKLLDSAAAGYLLTGNERMGELAADMMRGLAALSIGFENQREDPLVKYLQPRAIWTHNHDYEVDGRKVSVNYDGTHVTEGKWNVNSFEIPDNPMYGDIWVSNMRSKDDVPYMYYAINIATRFYHQTEDPEFKEAARLFIEYMRGFAQSIVDYDWYIMTRYEDGLTTIAVDRTQTGNPPADLGSYVTWAGILGPDAECNAQLGAALAGYGFLADRGFCGSGLAGWDFEMVAGSGNWFNYNIYNYFHIAALSMANLWGHTDLARSLMDGLIQRFDTLLTDPKLPNGDHKEFSSDSAGWLITAATQGYPLNAREARHIMDLYDMSADWYSQWEYWDPWDNLPEGQDFPNFDPPRDTTISDGQGGEVAFSHMRIVEMPYIFEYCYSPLKAANRVEFIDCDIVANPALWGDE